MGMAFLKLSDRKHYSLPPLASLTLISFIWSLSFSKESHQFPQALFPGFLLILSISLLLLSQIRTYNDDVKNGFLMILVGNKIPLHRYILYKYSASCLHSILPMTLLCTVILALHTGIINEPILISFALTHLLSCLVTLCLTHILSALTAHLENHSMHSLFLIWPLLIPSLLLSLGVMGAETMIDRISLIILNFALVLLSFGAMLLLTPRLLETTFESD